MPIELEEKVKRQDNGTLFLQKKFWEWIEADDSEEVCVGVDRGKYGKYVAIYKNKKE